MTHRSRPNPPVSGPALWAIRAVALPVLVLYLAPLAVFLGASLLVDAIDAKVRRRG